jgi:predicted GNAT family N-acyltransferase
MVDNQPTGIGFIARRGWSSRLAMMGVIKAARGRKAGSWFMEQLIQEARERGEKEMVLEVIKQNEPAVRLYKKTGFEIVRQLVGFVNHSGAHGIKEELQEIDLREMGRLIQQYGLPDLPWQLSGETIALLAPPARAFKKGGAYIAISNPHAETIVIWSVLVEERVRGNDLAMEILGNLMANYEGKKWHVPAIVPEEMGELFERAGFERQSITQWQMRLQLG